MTTPFHDMLVAELARMRNYALVLTRDPAAADDLLQEAALKAWKAQTQFQVGTNFKAWLYCIVRNEFLSLCRRAKWTPVSLDGLDDSHLSREGNQEDELACREVMVAMNRLPADQREVMFLRCVSGFSYDELATAQQCSVGTIKSRLWRARAAMQKALLGEDAVAALGNRPIGDDAAARQPTAA